MCGVCSYMHDLRVAHLDLSLENVVLSRDYRVAKLIDFGLALPVSRDAAGKEHISGRGSRGKLFYVAPEVFTEQAFVATVADVWSLGIMLFMMLTGCTLFFASVPRHPLVLTCLVRPQPLR